MESAMRKITAAGFGLALLSSMAALAGEPTRLTDAQLDGITAGEDANYGQKNDRGGWSGNNGGCFCQQRGDGDNSQYPDSGSSRIDGPSGGVGDQTGHTAQMRDKAQP